MMQKDMTLNLVVEDLFDLRVWRTRALNVVLTALAVAALPVVLLTIIHAASHPEQWLAALTFSAIYLLLTSMVLFRRVSLYLRAWTLLSLGYAAAALAFARGGLAGDGRMFLLGLPMLALILVGTRSALIAAALSLLMFAGFAVTAHMGLMKNWLVTMENTLALIDWVVGGAAFALILAGLMVMQWQLSRFLVRLAAEKSRLHEESERLRMFNENIVQSMDEGILLEDTTGHITFVNPKAAELLDSTPENLIGQQWKTFVPPEYVGKLQEETAKRLQGIAGRYEATLLARGGRRVPLIVSARPLSEDDHFSGVLSVFTDITELRQAEQALQRRNRELALLNDASRAFSSTLDLDQVLSTVLEEVRGLMSAVACSVWLLDPATGELICRQATGPQSRIVRGWRLAPGKGLAGWVARHGESLIVPDARSDDRHFKDVDEKTGLGLRSILSIPLQVRQDVIGVLQVMDTEVGRFNESDLELLGPLTASAAVAIENARLYGQARQEIAERERAEEATRRSEERYRSLFEDMPIGLYRTTLEGRILHANSALVQMLGYPDRQTLMAINIADTYVNAEDRRRWQAMLEREGGVSGHETQCRRHDGTIIWVRETARAMRDAQGRVVRYDGSMEDITARKRTEEALQQHTAQLEALRQVGLELTAQLDLDALLSSIVSQAHRLLEGASGGLYLYRPEQGVLEWSVSIGPEAVAPVGTILHRGEGLSGKVWETGQPLVVDDYQHWEGRAVAWEEYPIAAVVAVPVRWGEEFLGVLDVGARTPGAFSPADAELLTLFATQAAIAIQNARLYEAVQLELTERRRAEDELRKLSAVVEQSSEGIAIADLEGNLSFVNTAWAHMHGYEGGEELIGKHLNIFHSQEQLEQEVVPFNQKVRGNEFHTGEVGHIRKDGAPFPTLMTTTLLKDEQGTPYAMAGIARDITEHKLAEERTRRQERLAAVGQLAGGIAHDFNNLLTAIMLHAQIPLSKHDLPPNLARGLETILDQSRRAAELVQQILDFSRRSPIETHPLDLKPFVKETMRVLERTLPENIRLTLRMGGERYVVSADPTRIQQVLMNLVINARDAMPKGGELRVELTHVEVKPGEKPPVAEMPHGEWVCLAVSDTGTGIPPDVLPHILEPFFTTKEAGKGTGLGLAQVHGIVTQHGGYVGVETEVGQGTTFHIYLPAYKGKVEEIAKAPAPPKGRGETILLVEDEEKLRKVGQEILESLGYHVLVAANGQEALEAHRSAERVDLVITDVMMPGMGGRELMRELGKVAPHLRSIIITGYALAEDLETLSRDGIMKVVPKPFDIGALANAIRRVLNGDQEDGDDK